MNKLVDLIIKEIPTNGNIYRFDKISNFVSYDEFKKIKAEDLIIAEAEKIKIRRRFENYTNDEIETKIEKSYNFDANNRDYKFYLNLRIEGRKELNRRNELK